MKREYIHQIDIIRGIAILGVLATHATSFTVVEMTSSALYPLYIVLNKFGKLGTPTFICLSSFVLFYNYYYKPLDKKIVQNFYRKRFVYILTPYIFWSLFYHFLLLAGFALLGDEQLRFSINKLVTDLLFGKAYTHLYFVIINVQFYFVFPVFLLLLQKKRGLSKNVFWLGWAIQWMFILGNHYFWDVPYKGSIALSYMSNYTLGAVLGIYYEEIINLLKRFRTSFGAAALLVWLTAGVLHVVLYYYGYVFDEWVHSLWYELAWNVYTLISVIILYYLATFILFRGGEGLRRVLAELGGVSFGIYLIHPFFLLCWRQLPFFSDPVLYHFSIAGSYITALLASWVIVKLVQKYIPFSEIIFGPARR